MLTLSFENAPPFAAPLRFFLTAPLFALLAGLLVLVEGPSLLVSRWTPGALALTHLLTVGFMLQIMLGALIQILPVVAGAHLSRPVAVARAVHGGLTLGGLALAGGLYFMLPDLLLVAAGLLGVSTLVFLGAAGYALIGVPGSSPTIRGIRVSMVGLLGVLGSGLMLVLALVRGWALPLPELADLHAAWGLAGWAGALLAAVAFVVVPMFQLTPGYPARPAWTFPVLVLVLLILWSVALWAGQLLLIRFVQGALALLGMAFAGLTLRLQAQRRRARADATARYWQAGMVTSIFALFFVLTAAIQPATPYSGSLPLIVGILLLGGGFMAFINGMLYKIVPFLAWFHLQSKVVPGLPAPNMNKLLPDAAMQGQMKVHGLAVLLMLAAVFWPLLARPAGFFLALSSGWLGWNLLGAVRRYRAHQRLSLVQGVA